MMDYNEYRSQYRTVEEFNEAFKKLKIEEVSEMLHNTHIANASKAAIMTTWRDLNHLI